MRTAVVIVHGVGDPRDGDALSGLMAGLADSGFCQTRAPWTEHRVQPGDKRDGGSAVNTFPVHQARMTYRGSPAEPGRRRCTLHLHEVYWGDLSRVKGSAIGLLLALFDLIFGLRHIARAAAADAAETSRSFSCAVRWLTRGAGWAARAAECIARGPMLSLNILLGCVALLQWLLDQAWPLAPGLGMVLFFLMAWRADLLMGGRHLAFVAVYWLCVISLLALASAVWMRPALLPPTLVEALTTFVPDVVQVTPAHMAALMGPVLVAYPAWRLRPALRLRNWSLATLHYLLGFSLIGLGLASWQLQDPNDHVFIERITTAMSFFAALMACAAMLMMFLSLLAGVFAHQQFSRPEHPMAAEKTRQPSLADDLVRALVAMNFSTAFGVGLFVLLAMVAWTVVSTQVGPPMDLRIKEGLHLFVLVWLAFFVAAFVFMLIAAHNNRMKAQGSVAPRQRYIVNGWVCAAFLSTSCFYAYLFVPMSLWIEYRAYCAGQTNPADALAASYSQAFEQCLQARPFWTWVSAQYDCLVKPIEAMKEWVVTLTLALVAVGAAIRVHALQAVDVLLDVVAHFQTGLGTRDAKGEKRDDHPTWDAITDRFMNVLSNIGPVDRVVLVTHSQGTIVAMTALGLLTMKSRASQSGALARCDYELVTMGCPADHLYRHYMPRTYGAGPRNLRVNRWLNIYRLNDYIGTKFSFGAADWPTNKAVAPRGHADYWRDREVLQHLVDFLLNPKS